MTLQNADPVDAGALIVAFLAFGLAVVTFITSRRDAKRARVDAEAALQDSRRAAAAAEQANELLAQSNRLTDEELMGRHVRWSLRPLEKEGPDAPRRFELRNWGKHDAHEVSVAAPVECEHLETSLAAWTTVGSHQTKAFGIYLKRQIREPQNDFERMKGVEPEPLVDAPPERWPLYVLVSCRERDEPEKVLLRRSLRP